MGKAFFVADFYHRICGCLLHDDFEAVVDCSYKEGRIFICKAAAGGNVSVGMNVENVARTLTVVFFEPATGFPGAAVVARVGAGEVVDWDIFGETGGVTGGGATR